MFRNKKHFLRLGVVSTSPNTQAGGLPLVGSPRLLIQYIRSYPPHCRPFVHWQPEDAPCRDDRDPLITVCSIITAANLKESVHRWYRVFGVAQRRVCVWRILHLDDCSPYHLQIVQQPLLGDHIKRVRFHAWLGEYGLTFCSPIRHSLAKDSPYTGY